MRAFVAFTWLDPITEKQEFRSCFVTDAPIQTGALRSVETTLQKLEGLADPPTIIGLTLMPNSPTRKYPDGGRIVKLRP